MAALFVTPSVFLLALVQLVLRKNLVVLDIGHLFSFSRRKKGETRVRGNYVLKRDEALGIEDAVDREPKSVTVDRDRKNLRKKTLFYLQLCRMTFVTSYTLMAVKTLSKLKTCRTSHDQGGDSLTPHSAHETPR
jgi:hypothetical protein